LLTIHSLLQFYPSEQEVNDYRSPWLHIPERRPKEPRYKQLSNNKFQVVKTERAFNMDGCTDELTDEPLLEYDIGSDQPTNLVDQPPRPLRPLIESEEGHGCL
jgi:hypothetical protein